MKEFDLEQPIEPEVNWPSLALSIAGIEVVVSCNNTKMVEALRQWYHAHLVNREPDFRMRVELAGRQRHSALQDPGVIFRDKVLFFTAPGYEGFLNIQKGRGELHLSSTQPVEEVDYFMRVAYALLVFEAGGLLFHAAGILRKGCGYLFFGHSGAGKTTISRVSTDVDVLNDDLVILIPSTDKEASEVHWFVHGTPFWNPSQVQPTQNSAPLVAMFRLVQDKQVYLEAMDRGQALAEVISNVPVIPEDPARNAELLERGMHLLAGVPAYKLHFLPDASFWEAVESLSL